MKAIVIYQSKARMMGKIFDNGDEVSSFDSGETKEWFNTIDSFCETSLKGFPLMYIAVKTKYGDDAFKSPISNWSVVDNRDRSKIFEVKTALGDIYAKSSYTYQFVIDLEVSKGAALLMSRENEQCRKIAESKIEKIFIVTI
jgi:hypothetical protein